MLAQAQVQARHDESVILESLKMNSPFGLEAPSGKGDSAKDAKPEAANIQLQGVVFIEGKWMFSVTDVKQKKSFWLTLGEVQGGCKAESYDPVSGILNIGVGGKSYPVSLKERDALSGQAPPPQTASATPAAGAAAPADANKGPGRNFFRSATPEERIKFHEAMLKREQERLKEAQTAAKNPATAAASSGTNASDDAPPPPPTQ